jgi:hypothetical protein
VLCERSDANAILDRLEKSPRWRKMAVIVAHGEHVIAPVARSGFVDHTPPDTTSVRAAIGSRLGRASVGDAEARAEDLTVARPAPRSAGPVRLRPGPSRARGG